MRKTFFTSDLHINHNREFIYKARGYNSIEEMNDDILKKWNETVSEKDIVYVLGDLTLNDTNLSNINYLANLNGEIHFIRGNHDTERRINLYKELGFIDEGDAKLLTFFKKKIFLCHYPMDVSNPLDVKEGNIICLYGHTHQETNFKNDIPWMYHVGVDSHDCTPVSIDKILEDIKEKVKECEDML